MASKWAFNASPASSLALRQAEGGARTISGESGSFNYIKFRLCRHSTHHSLIAYPKLSHHHQQIMPSQAGCGMGCVVSDDQKGADDEVYHFEPKHIISLSAHFSQLWAETFFSRGLMGDLTLSRVLEALKLPNKSLLELLLDRPLTIWRGFDNLFAESTFFPFAFKKSSIIRMSLWLSLTSDLSLPTSWANLALPSLLRYICANIP